MKKCVGNIELHGKRLKYYVYGNRQSGYGVEITETYIEKAEQMVSQSLGKTLAFAQQLQQCSVFPANLSEIVDDIQFDSNID